MRVTSHNGRKGKAGVYSVKHNDRQFNDENAAHINAEKSKENVYWNCYENNDLSFEKAELKFYEENFSKMLENKNQRYIKQRHPERVQTMQEMIKNEKFCPEETLFYVGNKDDEVGKDKLLKIFTDFKEWHDKQYPNIKTLDYALHVDEQGAKHIHWRKVWTATDKYGDLTVGQNKALAEMNIKAPEPTKNITKQNNAKITYTAQIREKLFEICKNHGVEVEKTPREKSKSGLDLLEFQIRQEQEKLDKLTKKIALTKNDESSLASAKKQAEFKKKTLSRQEYVEVPVQAYNTIVSIAEHGINGNLANLALKSENDKLKRENKELKSTVEGAESKVLEKYGAENKKLRERNAELTQENVTLKSQNKALEQTKKNADLMQKFIKSKGQTREFASYSKSASKPTRAPAPKSR